MIFNYMMRIFDPINIAMLMMTGALLLAFVRLVRGPSLPDRVVALDLIASVTVGLTATYAVVTNHVDLLHIAVMLALIAFLGTVAFAIFVGKGEKV
ncbi:MAG TPA: monovalent cation/H+ antiporter complex subunit F [Pyrinomonadaceae bacterium]|nr:monovalent cation/H+ antiporter complex subunit F [Pyrinomonadaceae bacterium]